MTTTMAPPGRLPASVSSLTDRVPKAARIAVYAAIGVLVIATARSISHAGDLTSSDAFGTSLRLAVPIGLAGLGGLFAERSGTVNIGLEGMMILGTIIAGYAGWHWGAWAALIGGVVGGAVGGLLHALATVTFGVDHIVSGFAINILAPGVARFLANQWFTKGNAPVLGGSISSSPPVDPKHPIPHFTMPLISGGRLFGWRTPDPLGRLERKHWFAVSDVAGFLRGLTADLKMDTVVAVVLFFVATYVLWHTPFGLRLRSAGEKPSAAETLGVGVYKVKYVAMIISGGLAGLGGAVLVLAGANRYQEGMTQGLGYLGLAALIVGNWRPIGIAWAAGIFGFAQAAALRPEGPTSVHGLLLAGAIVFALVAVMAVLTRRYFVLVLLGAVAALTMWAYVAANEVNNQFVYITPYVVTLLVVTILSQRLRPPASGSTIWRKGQGT